METDRLLLRPFAAGDLPAYRLLMGQDEVGEQLPRGRGFTAEETDRLAQFWSDHWTQHGYGPFAVVERSSGTLLGHCGLKAVEETGEVELLYALGREHWGEGFATEAARACVAWADMVLDLPWLVGFVKPDNVRSIAVLTRAGFAPADQVHLWGLDLIRYRRPREDQAMPEPSSP
ncbi:MAG: GNAT family N-acetyltransferase [Actinobacteria bacterium]|nr:GNAT family N-acetyltransferase [Actinomycetota bacterium]